MSEVNEDSGLLSAGNTAASLAGVDRDVAADLKASLPSAADLDVVVGETAIAAATASVSDTPAPVAEDHDPLDDENTHDVSRAEFTELQEAFLRLAERIEHYNAGASHKI